MPIRTRENQYVGINAHLQSHFQNQGGWASFHNNYVLRLAEALDASLPAGYLVDIEQSLQIREYHPDTGERVVMWMDHNEDRCCWQTRMVVDFRPRHGEPCRYDPGNRRTTACRGQIHQQHQDLYYPGVVIYRQMESGTLGEAVTRIELLSPSNKQGHGEVQYREKRVTTLKSGVQLVEIDLLHQTPSPVLGVPTYPHQPGSTPYSITVSNPRPSLAEGSAETYGFHVEEAVPVVAIPLAKDDKIAVDFGAVYDTTFRSLSAYSYRVDYAEPPDRFDTYSPADQKRIKARMQAVRGDVDPASDA